MIRFIETLNCLPLCYTKAGVEAVSTMTNVRCDNHEPISEIQYIEVPLHPIALFQITASQKKANS